MKKTMLAVALAAMAANSATADRYTTLAAARNLIVTTTQGTTHYYLLGNDRPLVLSLDNGMVKLGDSDTFSPADIKSMRVKNMTSFVLDEDSTTFSNQTADKGKNMEHAILLLRRSLVAGQWNSLVLPVQLTAGQVLDAFGQEAQLATVSGLREGSNAIVDIATIDLHTATGPVVEAGKHYLLKPSREADVAEGKTALLFADKPKGPVYLIPDVSMSGRQLPSLKSYVSADKETTIRVRGTYTRLDGSSIVNSKVYGGKNPVYVFDDNGSMQQHTDSVLVKAFTTWIADMSSQARQLSFYIDGVSIYTPTDGVAPVQAQPATGGLTCDLTGRPVGNGVLRPGIYVRNGRKIIVK